MGIPVKAKIAGAYLLCALVWGTTWFAIRVSIGPGGFPTYEAAALRFSIAVAVIAPLGVGGLASLKQQVGRQLWWVCVAGFLNAVSYSLVYKGEESVAGLSGLPMSQMNPLLGARTAVRLRARVPSASGRAREGPAKDA